MYSFTTSGENVVIKNISNPKPTNQSVIATVASSSSDVTWSYTAGQDSVKFYVSGNELVPAKFTKVQIDGSYCTGKEDFVSKITTCLPASSHINSAV